MLNTVGGKNIVVGGECQCGADLRRFLPATGHPQSHLLLPLKCRSFVVNAAGNVHQAVGFAKLFCVYIVHIRAEGGVLVYFAVLIHQLDAFGYSRIFFVLVHQSFTQIRAALHAGRTQRVSARGAEGLGIFPFILLLFTGNISAM